MFPDATPPPPQDDPKPAGASDPGRNTGGIPASKGRSPDAPVPPLANRLVPAVPSSAPILQGPGPATPEGVTMRSGRAGGPSRAVQDHWVARLREGDASALREVVAAFEE